jgi:hypothetical protein
MHLKQSYEKSSINTLGSRDTCVVCPRCESSCACRDCWDQPTSYHTPHRQHSAYRSVQPHPSCKGLNIQYAASLLCNCDRIPGNSIIPHWEFLKRFNNLFIRTKETKHIKIKYEETTFIFSFKCYRYCNILQVMSIRILQNPNPTFLRILNPDTGATFNMFF